MRGTTIFVPPVDSSEAWETIVDFTKIKRGGVLLEDILKRL